MGQRVEIPLFPPTAGDDCGTSGKPQQAKAFCNREARAPPGADEASTLPTSAPLVW
jgi:hypothetical protein